MLISVLASGSKGNCTYLSIGKDVFLIDAGITYSQLKKRTKAKGLPIDNIQGIFITHEHWDHVKEAYAISEKTGATVYFTELAYSYLLDQQKYNAELISPSIFNRGENLTTIQPKTFIINVPLSENSEEWTGQCKEEFEERAAILEYDGMLPKEIAEDTAENNIREKYKENSIGIVAVKPFQVSHDTTDPIGFLIKYSSFGDSKKTKTIGFLTDTGVIPKEAKELFINADLICIESNHDPLMLINGEYPEHIIDRVNSTVGHLSNDDCAEYVRTLDGDITQNVVLLHVSENNNSTEAIEKTFNRKLQKSTKTLPIIHIADQKEGSPVFYL